MNYVGHLLRRRQSAAHPTLNLFDDPEMKVSELSPLRRNSAFFVLSSHRIGHAEAWTRQLTANKRETLLPRVRVEPLGGIDTTQLIHFALRQKR